MAGRQHSTMIENPIPTWDEARTTTLQTIDPNMIADAIRKHFRVKLEPVDGPVYRKPYPEWIDKPLCCDYTRSQILQPSLARMGNQ
ncbi:hypothetical protein JHK87_001156 [Glycine soja]|nr:hypothetical protein JHK87_001156 [Glycine soja]